MEREIYVQRGGCMLLSGIVESYIKYPIPAVLKCEVTICMSFTMYGCMKNWEEYS